MDSNKNVDSDKKSSKDKNAFMKQTCPSCKGTGVSDRYFYSSSISPLCTICKGSGVINCELSEVGTIKYSPVELPLFPAPEVAYVKVLDGGTPPYKKHTSDSCWDLFARKIEWLDDNTVKVSLGVAIEPPTGYDVRLYPRSSFSKYDWILSNHIGIGDENYRGEYVAIFKMLPRSMNWDVVIKDVWGDREEIKLFDTSEFPYNVGDRCIQMEIRKKDNVELRFKEELSDTDRGDGGFGSTGK